MKKFSDVVIPFMRSPFNYDRNAAGDEDAVNCSGEASMTKQSFAEECDINTIVRRFNLTGQLPSDLRVPQYGDFDGIFDYHSAMNAVAQAGESFDRLPAALRARFHNDPSEFVDFCLDEGNRPEAIKLGLVQAQAADLAGDAPLPGAAPARGSPGEPGTPSLGKKGKE